MARPLILSEWLVTSVPSKTNVELAVLTGVEVEKKTFDVAGSLVVHETVLVEAPGADTTLVMTGGFTSATEAGAAVTNDIVPDVATLFEASVEDTTK